MRVIGLTGGVGSGKSVAAHILEKEYHALLLITDELGHRVMEPGTDGYRQVVSVFGDAILDEDGAIDRDILAKRVFGDEAARQRLNGIIHPQVISYVERYIRERKDVDGLIVLESALLFESGCDKLCDSIWYVSVTNEVRKRRLMEGRGYTEVKTASIMERQLSEKEFLQRSNIIVENNGSEKELRQAIRQAFEACQL